MFNELSVQLCMPNIWQPFSSGKGLSHPKFAVLLDEICTRLARNDLSGNDGRAAILWRVLTMRGLQPDQELPLSPALSSTSTLHQSSQFSNRASQAVKDILEKPRL
jgi:hypothetical protein